MSNKKRKYTQSYCQRLAQNLDRFDQKPTVRNDNNCNIPLPPILRLPAELRQDIIFQTRGDDGLYSPRPDKETGNLSLVCKAFAADVKIVKKLWDAREKKLMQNLRVQLFRTISMS